nr:DUF2157 domain-containing protein [Mesorhizobium sp.]
MAGYVDKVGQDIARWEARGLVTSALATQLRDDVAANHGKGIGFGQVLAVMAALLMAAAILILIAANWEAIPRLGRVGALFAVIAGGYLGGAVLKLRDHGALAEAVWLVSAAAFGGGIALIGQMYHLSGDETQAILVWCVGTALAAALLRSPILAAASVALSAAWVAWPVFSFSLDVNPWYPLLLAALWAVAVWTRSLPARHLILLSLIGHFTFLYMDTDQLLIPAAMALVSAAAFVAAVRGGEVVDRLAGLGDGLAADALIGFLVGMFTLQFVFADSVPMFSLLAAVTFAAIAGALVIGGKAGRKVRWLAYLGFAVEISFVYIATVGTMLGTAGFFLLAAIGLGVLAFVIIRVERRMAAPAATQGAA